jgi:hypothetical protein
MGDKKDDKKKPDQEGTLARFFGDDEKELNTQVIDKAKQFAHRRLGRTQGRPLIDALERLEKKRKEEKGKK